MAFSNPITGGQGALVRPAIKSPNYVPGQSGWTINRDGTAEFSDLLIRSSDGSGNTIALVNGRIVITTPDGQVVTEIDAAGYRLFNEDATDNLVAQIILDAGLSYGGFYTRNYAFPTNTYAFLAGGYLVMAPMDDSADIGSSVQYAFSPDNYAALTMTSGVQDITTDDEARLQLVVEPGERPKAWVDGGSQMVKADLEVTGELYAANLQSGIATVPAPSPTPGQSFVNVTFWQAFDTVPQIQLTPEYSGADLNNANIRLAVTNVTTTGMRIVCWRGTNNPTTVHWHATTSS